MNSIKKRFLASAMALLFVGIPLLFFITLGAHKYHVTQFGKKGLKYFDKEHVESLMLPAAEYAHLKRGTEFSLNDCRYDILEVKQEGNTVYILAFNDTREKKLNDGIGQFHGPVKQSGMKFTLPDWVPPMEVIGSVMSSCTFVFPNRDSKCVYLPLEVDFPPPKAASCA